MMEAKSNISSGYLFTKDFPHVNDQINWSFNKENTTSTETKNHARHQNRCLVTECNNVPRNRERERERPSQGAT